MCCMRSPAAWMKDAWARESGVLLLLEREDGRQSGVYVSADGDARETDAPTAREAGRQAVSGGVLAWQEERGGAVVTLEDAQGGEIWRLRTVIHTAADRLEWRCALELPDGSYALGGRYLTGEGQRTEQAAALAVVGHEGVLRRIVPVEAKEAGQRVGCVCDMAYDAESGLLLLVSRTEDGAENVGAIQTADGANGADGRRGHGRGAGAADPRRGRARPISAERAEATGERRRRHPDGFGSRRQIKKRREAEGRAQSGVRHQTGGKYEYRYRHRRRGSGGYLHRD